MNEWSIDINIGDDVVLDQPVGPTIHLRDNMKAVDCLESDSGANQFVSSPEEDP